MTNGEFEALLQRRIDKMRRTLSIKAGEYASGADRLHNFKRAAEMTRRTPAQALIGMLAKHWVSVLDLVERDAGQTRQNPDVLDEKIGDSVNYLVLLEALLTENAE